LTPIAQHYPSTSGSASFKPVADYLHGLGLKFGVWIMRGIPRKAVEQKLPIKGTTFTADQIANVSDGKCSSLGF
jgi:alpha-galactosidase